MLMLDIQPWVPFQCLIWSRKLENSDVLNTRSELRGKMWKQSGSRGGSSSGSDQALRKTAFETLQASSAI